MIYSQLGASSIKISRIGLGGNIFGCFTNQKETTEIIAKASYLGINFIDTASVYSDGLSETMIGKSIKKDRRKWILATKLGVRSNEKPDGKASRKSIITSVEASLKRLQTDYIDLYQMHHFDPRTPLEESVETLEHLGEQGKLRLFGVTNFTKVQLNYALAITRKNKFHNFAGVQNHYNLFKRDIERYLFTISRKNKLSIIVYGALARGILSGKYLQIHSFPSNSRAKKSESIRKDLTSDVIVTLKKLSDYAHEYNWTLPGLALAWILRKKEITSVLVGIRTYNQLEIIEQTSRVSMSHKNIEEIDSLVGNLERFKNIGLGSFVSLI